jgi:hypothetical protein
MGTTTEEFFDSILDTNVKGQGLLLTVQKALRLLPDGASIILNASMVGSKGLPAYSVYSATKAAVSSFARTCAPFHVDVWSAIRRSEPATAALPEPHGNTPGSRVIRKLFRSRSPLPGGSVDRPFDTLRSDRLPKNRSASRPASC